jgi:tetratricopeptide (TPR) repeat protein
MKQLAEGKPEESVHVATDLHAMLVKHKLTEETLPEFFIWNIANHMTDGRMSVSFLEAVISLHQDDKEFECCRDHLPCMYHAAAYRYPSNSTEHKEYLEKADKAFTARFSQQGVSGAYCDYVLLLIKQNRHSEAITWLDKVIEEDNANFGNVYDANEIMTVDKMIQNEIVEHNNFSAPSTSLAYYLKAICLHAIKEDKKDTMNNLLENFKQHSDVVKLPRTYALLGYSYMDCGEWKAASDTLSLAIKADTQGEYTRAVKMKNYCDRMISKNNKESN